MGTHLLDPQLLDALLKHPSITQDHHIVCPLLATSNAACTAIAARSSGQLAVQLTAGFSQQQKVSALATWLQRHARLLQKLDIRLSGPDQFGNECNDSTMYVYRSRDHSTNKLDQVAAALKHAASAGVLLLQQFALAGSVAPPELIAVLPAESLTSLDCTASEVPDPSDIFFRLSSWEPQRRFYATLYCIGQLTELRLLDLSTDHALYKASSPALEVLSRLEHLTKLQLGGVTVSQLRQLPPNLQEWQSHLSSKMTHWKMRQKMHWNFQAGWNSMPAS